MTRRRNVFYFSLALAMLILPLGCHPRNAPPMTVTEKPKPELIAAVLKNDTATAQALLDKGADIESRNPLDGRTGLMLAALRRQTGMVKLFLQRGAKLEPHDDEGMTALMWGAFGGSSEVVQALLDRGAKWDVKSKNGETALDWGRDYPATVALLKQAAAKK